MKWEELPMASRARLMEAAVKNGYTDIRSIKEAYANYLNQKQSTGNRYAEGGDTNEDSYHDSFYEWKKAISEYMGLDIDNDDTYDYMGFYYGNPARAWAMLNGDPNAHFTDRFKTAKHPTFSTESDLSGKYDPINNPLIATGGTWTENPNTFTLPQDWYKGPSIQDRISYLENAEDNGVTMFMPDGSLPTLYNNEPWGGVLPAIEVTNQNGYGGNLFKDGGNKSKQSRKDYYRQQLMIRGLRGAQLEAVLANMEVESGFNPKAYNKSSGAQGLMQWLGSRKPKSWKESDLLDYIAATYNKFGGNEWLDKAAWKRFNQTTDPAEAARLFRRYWERPEKSSWYATDKIFNNNKNSYLPEETNNLIQQLSDISWQDVQERRKRFELTPEEERLYNSKPTLFYDADYADWDNPNEKTAFEQAYAPYALNQELDNRRTNGWNLYNSLLASLSQNDPLSWMANMTSLSPNTTPQQKEATFLYQLFAPQGDDYMYHGLNFAAYGGKVNKFETGGPYSDEFMNNYGYKWIPASQILVSDPYFKEIQEHNPNGTYAVDKNGYYIPARRIKQEWEKYNSGQAINGPETAIPLDEVVHTFNDKDKQDINVANRLWGNARKLAYENMSNSVGDMYYVEHSYMNDLISPNEIIRRLDTINQHSTYPKLYLRTPDNDVEARHDKERWVLPDGTLRAHYDRDNFFPWVKRGNIYVDAGGKDFLSDYIAELAHNYQYTSKDNIEPSLLRGEYYTGIDYDDMAYGNPKYSEYRAHSVIEPTLLNYISNIDVFDGVSTPYYFNEAIGDIKKDLLDADKKKSLGGHLYKKC